MKRNPGFPTAVQAESLESRVLFASTSDPLFSSQYGLANTAVADAWDTTRGSAAVVIAGIDTGTDYTHRDLYSNVWINQAEIPASVKSSLRDGRAVSGIDEEDAGSHDVLQAAARLTQRLGRGGEPDAGIRLPRCRDPCRRGGTPPCCGRAPPEGVRRVRRRSAPDEGPNGPASPPTPTTGGPPACTRPWNAVRPACSICAGSARARDRRAADRMGGVGSAHRRSPDRVVGTAGGAAGRTDGRPSCPRSAAGPS